jgi:hypothetical protein
VVLVKDHHLWIGKKGGWGIIAGTGGKCVRGRSLPYGKPFTTGDLISIKLDFNTRAVAFAVNGEWQGLAFENLSGPVTVGASTTGCGTCIELMEDPYFEVKGDKVQMKAVVQKNRLAVPKATIRESKRNALSTAWDPAVKSSFTQVQGAQNDIAVNPGSNNKWTAIRGVVAFDPKVDGKQSFTVKIRATGTTPNSWKFIAGLVPVKFTCKRSKHWIGAYGGYGYIAGTGKKCHDTSTAGGYGATWGDLNDTIKCEVDYSVGEVGFYRNNVYQGVAFTNVPKLPLYPALSLTAADCQVQMIHHT